MPSVFKYINVFLHQVAVFSVIVCLLTGCQTTNLRKYSFGQTELTRTSRNPISDEQRKRLLSVARAALGKSSFKVGKKSFRSDCSGVIRAIFTKARIGLGGIIKNTNENDVKAIYRYVKKYGSISKENPRVGDLVFFHNTYDRSRNGRMNDALTHIGIVEKIEGTTVHFIHHLGQSVIRSRMDLSRPKETFHQKTGERINHVLRKAQGSYRAYTAAELFAGFGRL